MFKKKEDQIVTSLRRNIQRKLDTNYLGQATKEEAEYVETMYKLVLEEEKLRLDKKSKRNDRISKICTDVLGIAVPAAVSIMLGMFYLQYEEEGIIKSQIVRNFIGKIHQFKK